MFRPILALAGVALLATAVPANAVLVLNSTGLIGGNDCAGDLGNPPNCFAFESGLIAKFDFSPDQFTPGLFPSIDGGEFSFTGGGTPSGTFTYTPGGGDPAIKFWSLKSSNEYEIFWFTDNVAGGPGSAVGVPTGVPIDWATSNQQDISHISFYDSDDQQIPEPASLAMLGLGLLGLGLVRRRKN